MGNPEMDEIVHLLSIRAIDLALESSSDLEQSCWRIVHEYRHGVMPSEYDIRDIDEDLYLAILKNSRKIKDGSP